MVSVSTNPIKREQMATQARTQIQELEVITEQSLALLEITGLGCSGFEKINKQAEQLKRNRRLAI
jgi:hypothetical protein